MRIVYLHQYFKFPDENGGTRSYDLAASFIRKGYDITVVTATSDKAYSSGRRWTIKERDRIKVHYIYLPYRNDMSYILRSVVFLKFLWFSSFRVLRINTDVLLASSTPLTIGIPALVKKWLAKTPFVFEVRDVWPEAAIAIGAIGNKMLQKLLYALERLIYRNAAVIVPLSTDMQTSIVSRYPEFANKASVVIENIAEINRFQVFERNRNPLAKRLGFQPRYTVLYAGTFGRVNGLDKAIELAEKTLLLDDKLIYILIGSGAEKANIVKLAGKKGVLGKNVFIFEPVSKNSLPTWYHETSIGSSFVIDIKELWANSANKFFDTLAAGKPVLINHEGWQAEVIRTHNVGYVLPQVVTDSCAQEFVGYSKNDLLHKEQCLNAIRLAQDRYSLDKAVDKYLEVLEKIRLCIKST